MIQLSLWNSLLDFLFPPHCPLCHAYVEERGSWCPSCLQRGGGPHRLLLPAAGQRRIRFAWALGGYRGGLRSLVHDLKYRRKKSILPYIDTYLRHVRENHLFLLPADLDVAVPVPLHAARERERGFNQVEAIFARALSVRQLPLERLLQRQAVTQPLYRLTPGERRHVVQHAFSAAPGAAIAGRHILLLDDILTTGTTATACAEVLMAAGASSVDVLVFASDYGK
ncbi:MAG: double zinc ribbon domain-containing protein [Selenomonadaceae bacterium]|nr:double zinc ribbon domain-containing protein [Selenomonadaceae bacterium]